MEHIFIKLDSSKKQIHKIIRITLEIFQAVRYTNVIMNHEEQAAGSACTILKKNSQRGQCVIDFQTKQGHQQA